MSKLKITLLALFLGLLVISAFYFFQQKNITDQDIDTSKNTTAAQEKPMTLIEIKPVPAPTDSISR